MNNPTAISWTPAATNTDGSPIAAGEITGYAVGVRLASGDPGTYFGVTKVAADASSFPIASFNPQPTRGAPLVAAVQSIGPENSTWAESAAFTLAVPIPNPPSACSVA